MLDGHRTFDIERAERAHKTGALTKRKNMKKYIYFQKLYMRFMLHSARPINEAVDKKSKLFPTQSSKCRCEVFRLLSECDANNDKCPPL